MRKLKNQSIILLLSILVAFFGITVDKSVGEVRFKAELSGDEEVPPLKTKAKGEANFDLSNEGDELTYRVVLEGIENITAAHIHKGKTGENGPPVADLFREPRKEAISGILLSKGTIAGYKLTGPLKGKTLHSLIELIEAGEAYVNVHTKDYPEGEIRGQIK